MADQTHPPGEVSHDIRLWKLGIYFLLLGLFAYLNLELFRELQSFDIFIGLEKVEELLNRSFDVSGHWDDIIVTLYSLLMTFIFVVPVGWVYLLTKEAEGIDPSLAQTVVVLGLVVCGVMMLLQDSLARAFGLVGVVAAVRYRNTLKDAKDAVYVFLAIGVGMGCGLGEYHTAVLLSVTISGVFLLLWKFRIGFGLRTGSEAGVIQGLDKKTKGMKFSLSKEVEERVAGELGQHQRLVGIAKDMGGKEKKRPNAAIIIESSSPLETRLLARHILEPGNRQWSLMNIVSRDGKTLFEYLGRLNAEDDPVSLVEELRREGASFIQGVEFRSLKTKKKKNKEVEDVS